MSENIEEAKVAAAEEVLSHIGFQADGTPAVIPMATVISPPANGYQVSGKLLFHVVLDNNY